VVVVGAGAVGAVVVVGAGAVGAVVVVGVAVGVAAVVICSVGLPAVLSRERTEKLVEAAFSSTRVTGPPVAGRVAVTSICTGTPAVTGPLRTLTALLTAGALL
jgi:hypothetical protein